MNIELLKKTTKEDYDRRLAKVIEEIEIIEEHDKSGLFKRILGFNRQWLFQCMGKVLRVSQTSVIYNRDELDFFESLVHFMGYYMWDDGELCIRYERYFDGNFVDCKKTDRNARPYLGYLTYEDEKQNNPVAREKEVLHLLDVVERYEEKRIKLLIEDEMVAEDYRPNPEDYIDYL